jgi:hypothetical protein
MKSILSKPCSRQEAKRGVFRLLEPDHPVLSSISRTQEFDNSAMVRHAVRTMFESEGLIVRGEAEKLTGRS